MNRWHFVRPIVLLAALLSCPVLASGGAYTINVGGERLEFVPQTEKGYVIKLAQKAGGIHALAGISALDAEGAREVRGLDRHGVWTVENEGPASHNEDTVRSLRTGGQVAYAAPLFSSGGETVAIIPEIVVRVKPGTDSAQVKALCEKAACRLKKRMEFTQQEYLLEVLGPDAEAVFAAVEQLSQAPEVEWACPNTAFRPKLAGQAVSSNRVPSDRLGIASAGQDANNLAVFPNDEYFPKQWHLHNTGQSGGTPGADIRAPEAWEITTGDPNIVVAVLDTGVESKHPDLVNNLVPGYDFYENDDQPDPTLDNPHGTACAGLIAARGNNLIGVSGVTWDCSLMPARAYVWGDWGATPESDIATALRWAATHGADIISNSWGDNFAMLMVRSALADITRAGGIGRDGKGCIVLFASGNEYGPMQYPGKYPEVVAVGASNHNDVRCNYSNYGPELDIVAPSAPSMVGMVKLVMNGQGWIWTTDITGLAGLSSSFYNPYPGALDYALFQGTSAACPIAAGVAALILSVEPNLTGAEVRHFLERSAKDLGDPGRDDYYGWGRVDARAALDMVLANRCDLNNDWQVDEQDLAILNAAIDANDLSADIAPAKRRDGKVDANDLNLLIQYMGKEIPELGLFARWKLDETEGVTAYDCVNHRDGTLEGGTVWQPTGGQVDGAVQLDGINDYVSTPFVLNPSSGPFSVFAWVKGDADGKVIVSQKSGANWLLIDSSGKLMTELKAAGTSGGALVSEAIITDGNWHRAGFVWDGTSRILYVDGIEVARDAQATLTPSSGSLYIGAGSTKAATSFWKGLIDDVRIYDRAVKP